MNHHWSGPVTDIAYLTELARGASRDIDAPRAAQAIAAREALCAALRSPDLLTRILAADGLHEAGDSTCVEALLGTLNDEDALMRRAALRALGRIGAADSEALIFSLQNPEVAVRVAASETLCALDARYAIPQLCAALRDPCPEVVAAAAGALGRFKSPESVAPLCRELLRSGRALPDFVYGRPDTSWTWEERRRIEQQSRALVAMVRALQEIESRYAAGTLCELIGESFWRQAAVAAAEGLEQLLPQLSSQQLAVAIPVLKNQLPPWYFEPKERRETFRRVLHAVQARHRDQSSLPLPSQHTGNPADHLPRPAIPHEPLPQELPIPTQPTRDS